MSISLHFGSRKENKIRLDGAWFVNPKSYDDTNEGSRLNSATWDWWPRKFRYVVIISARGGVQVILTRR